MPMPEQVRWTLLGRGIQSAPQEWKTVVARNADELSGLVSILETPLAKNTKVLNKLQGVDLSRKMVIGVFSGDQPTLQCGVEIDYVVLGRSGYQVYVSKIDEAGQEAMSRPYCVIELPAHQGKPVFYERTIPQYQRVKE